MGTAPDVPEDPRTPPAGDGQASPSPADSPADAPGESPEDADRLPEDALPVGAGPSEGAAATEASAEATSEEPGAQGRKGKGEEPPPAPPPPERLLGAVEAMLLSASEPLSAERLRDLLGLPSVVHVREAVSAIRQRWAEAGLAVELQDLAGGHRAATRPEYAEYVRRLWKRPPVDRLSATLVETLSIVAYKQPVARAEIERIRGVQCSEALRALLERRLVKVAGRSDQPGRPLLYATTARFLEVFGLGSLSDLPNAKDLRV